MVLLSCSPICSFHVVSSMMKNFRTTPVYPSWLLANAKFDWRWTLSILVLRLVQLMFFVSQKLCQTFRKLQHDHIFVNYSWGYRESCHLHQFSLQVNGLSDTCWNIEQKSMWWLLWWGHTDYCGRFRGEQLLRLIEYANWCKLNHLNYPHLSLFLPNSTESQNQNCYMFESFHSAKLMLLLGMSHKSRTDGESVFFSISIVPTSGEEH